MFSSRSASPRATRACLLAAIVSLVGACGSEPARGPAADEPVVPPLFRLAPAVAESWVQPERWPGYWTIWADVRELVGEERWAALDTTWMEARARTDLAAVTTENDYEDIFVLSGLWRLGMLREEVLAVHAAREPEAAWPLVTPDRSRGTGWRLRIEHWRRARPEGERDSALAGKLEESWNEAVAASDVHLAARVIEARQTWLGESPAPEAVRADVEKMVRASLETYLRAYGEDWRYGHPPSGVIGLMERFGVPDGVDVDAVVAAAQHYYRKTLDGVRPLPHPFDLNIRVQRLQRLANARGD